jgi:hypothetical protein
MKENIDEKREVRVVNRNFGLSHYDSSWTKIERYLFIEVYNVIKDFFMSVSDENIVNYTSDSILLNIPLDSLDQKLFPMKNRAKQLFEASNSLINKSVKMYSSEKGQMSFSFVNIFISIKLDIKSKYLEVKLPKEIYEEMIPIKSYCMLDLELLGELRSGNTIRLYEIFKSYAFKHDYRVTFDELRKKMGFFEVKKYTLWNSFNAKVLKPAVANINKFKEFDIEVEYWKDRGSEDVCFKITTHRRIKARDFSILSLDSLIDRDTRKLNMIQVKYIDTLISNCKTFLETKGEIINEFVFYLPGMITAEPEYVEKESVKQTISMINGGDLKEWIISDLINLQQKKGKDFDWKHSANGISKQIRLSQYTKPFCHC